ncbi:MAG: flagellar motor stator protein MotA [Alphaproteobacteria bacterium]
MKFVGLLLVFVCTYGGLLVAMHFNFAHFTHLMMGILEAMPGELIIILGCALCAFIIGNSMDTVKHTIKYMGALAKPTSYSQEDYIELFSALFSIFKLARTKGWLALEAHIEKPEESELFKRFPKFAENHHAVAFICDYLRLISLGKENPYELSDLMDMEIETIEAHEGHPGHAVQHMADGIPALGIVAAVLGVIKTMASISEPPEVLGQMIGGALVGTFLGVWLSYAFVSPIAGAMTARAQSEVQYYKAIKMAIIAFLNGSAPQVALEFSRKFLSHDVQPSFQELETKLNELPPPA